MSPLWNRDEPQFFNIFDLPWREVADVDIARGVDGRLISKDAKTNAATAMLRLPGSWQATASGSDTTLELFVLEGDLTVNGTTVGAGGYAAIPRGRGGAQLSSQGGASLYLWSEPNLPADYYYPDQQVQVTRVWQEPWITTEMPQLRHGIMHKSLRYPDPAGGLLHGGPGGMLRFILMTPGFGETRQEIHHDCWEEIIWLAGDFLMPGRGLHKAGSLLNNPAELPHGGLTTQKGTVMILHCNAPMGADFVPVPHGEAMVQKYLDNASWIAEDEHREWSLCQEFHVQEPAPEPELVG